VASVGDCKAFHWDSKTRQVTDITEGNRSNLTDASDPGGRLGPYLEEGSPDLRNLDLYLHRCNDGDIIFCVSDGVHDNYDPQQLGKSPRDFGIPSDTWQHAEKTLPLQAEEAKTHFRLQMMEEQFISLLNEQERAQLLPTDVVNTLLTHCWNVTSASREFMESNPTKKLPADYNLYPGKQDHATCIAVHVGSFSERHLESSRYSASSYVASTTSPAMAPLPTTAAAPSSSSDSKSKRNTLLLTSYRTPQNTSNQSSTSGGSNQNS